MIKRTGLTDPGFTIVEEKQVDRGSMFRKGSIAAHMREEAAPAAEVVNVDPECKILKAYLLSLTER